jgi:hypothetical protein
VQQLALIRGKTTAMRACVMILCLPLLGCASSAESRSPDFKAGYSDGCASANLQGADKRDSSLTRDDAAYQTNKAYRAGWGSGLGACRRMDEPQTPASGGGQFGGPFGAPPVP